MSIKNICFSGVKRLVNGLGLHVTKKSNALSYSAALERLASKGIKINTVIDVGASTGCWSRTTKKYYPDAFYYLIEANECHQEALSLFKKNNDRTDYIIAAASNEAGNIFFDASDPFGGVASQEKQINSIKTPAITIDHEILKHKLEGPFFLKLDTHGFEVPILEGAKNALDDTNLIALETYNFKQGDQGLKFWEICEFLNSKGFRPIDLAEPGFRPKDKVFWQIDILFARQNRPEFLSSSYV